MIYTIFPKRDGFSGVVCGWSYEAKSDAEAIRTRPDQVGIRVNTPNGPTISVADISNTPFEIWRGDPAGKMVLVYEEGSNE